MKTLQTIRSKLPFSDRLVWGVLALGAAALAVSSIVLTELLDLHPCHLCIFQRLLFMMLTVFCGVAAWRPDGWAGRVCAGLVLAVAGAGVGVASYQSWLQWEAAKNPLMSCAGADPNAMERFVDWLGASVPSLFEATGYCEDTELIIFWLSLANWALLSYLGFFLAAALLILGRSGQPQG